MILLRYISIFSKITKTNTTTSGVRILWRSFAKLLAVVWLWFFFYQNTSGWEQRCSLIHSWTTQGRPHIPVETRWQEVEVPISLSSSFCSLACLLQVSFLKGLLTSFSFPLLWWIGYSFLLHHSLTLNQLCSAWSKNAGFCPVKALKHHSQWSARAEIQSSLFFFPFFISVCRKLLKSLPCLLGLDCKHS